MPDANYDRITKTYRVAKIHTDLLAEAAFKKSREIGKSITQADILEDALNHYFFGGNQDAIK
jgi:hypothetical protein